MYGSTRTTPTGVTLTLLDRPEGHAETVHSMTAAELIAANPTMRVVDLIETPIVPGGILATHYFVLSTAPFPMVACEYESVIHEGECTIHPEHGEVSP